MFSSMQKLKYHIKNVTVVNLVLSNDRLFDFLSLEHSPFSRQKVNGGDFLWLKKDKSIGTTP